MSITRRRFMQGATTGAAALRLTGEAVASPRKSSTGRRQRTIYFNDARHYYLFVFEPPMKLEDAWRPVDEAAGTAVDTFVYGVARIDGLFYPSKVGKRFKYGRNADAFQQAAYWRLWHNMQSLIDRGLDPLRVLIDRAHQKEMDFFASLRLVGYSGIDPAHKLSNYPGGSGKSGGRGFAHPQVRDHQFAVLQELATDYPTEGVELDFAFSTAYFREQDVETYTPVMTEWVRKVSNTVRNRSGEPGQIGARVYPTQAINRKAGLDVDTWLREGLLDYVVPMIYGYMLVDSQMPIDWLIEAAHATQTSVYPMISPYSSSNQRRHHNREWATPAMMRAAVSNYWDQGADGMYTWFLKWPLGDTERRILSELGDPDLVQEASKHYRVNRSLEAAERVGYQTTLPLEIPVSEQGKHYAIAFTLADDIEGAADRIRQVRLKINIADLVLADQLTVLLNGQSLAEETCLRSYGLHIAPYVGQWLEFELKKVRPRRGQNRLEIVLNRRAEGLVSPLRVEDVEIIVEYGSYPSALNFLPPSIG